VIQRRRDLMNSSRFGVGRTAVNKNVSNVGSMGEVYKARDSNGQRNFRHDEDIGTAPRATLAGTA